MSDLNRPIREASFTPTAEESRQIREAMAHRRITRVSEYVGMAVMQVVRRELAARQKGSSGSAKVKTSPTTE